MARKYSSITRKPTKNTVIGQSLTAFSKADPVRKTIQLRNGSSLVDTEQKTTLIHNHTVLNSWHTDTWNLLGVDSKERVAFFEASDSWLLAKLDLETGAFQPDNDPLFIQYDLDVDEGGTFVFDEVSTQKYYIK